MSPADELRAAATRLEELAAAASGGQWSAPQRLTDPDPDGWDVLNGLEGMAEHQVFATSDICNPRGHADLTWAAALCPQVTAPLVALLNAAADAADNYPALEDPDSHVSRMVADPDQAGSYRYTAHLIRNGLDLARVINGTTS